VNGTVSKRLAVTILVYAAASLIHFIHNAEFLADYPGLPTTWTRAGVYLAWIAMTAVGALGLFLLRRGVTLIGLLVLAIYALLGMDSLGHYVIAATSAHTSAMNVTILFEVGAGALVFIEAMRLILRHVRCRSVAI
jgi:hypothetical protein